MAVSCASSVQVSVSGIWAAVVHDDGSSFLEARQAGLVGAEAIAKLGAAALETLSEMSSSSTDAFFDWKNCVSLVNFSLKFVCNDK